MIMAIPEWLEELLDEYPGTKRTSKAMHRLGMVFGEVPNDVMLAAVYKYMREQTYFPSVSDLRPYVQVALEAQRGEWPEMQIRFGKDEDEARLAWEQSLGLMPTRAEIEAEVKDARRTLADKLADKVAAIKASYARSTEEV